MKTSLITFFAAGFFSLTAFANATTMGDMTDYSPCYGPTTAASIEGNWQMVYAQGPLSYTMVFQIRQGMLRVSNECSMSGRSVTASAAVPAFYNATTLATQGSASDQQSRGGIDCSVSIEPSSMNYSFQGRCLVFTAPNEPTRLMLVPR